MGSYYIAMKAQLDDELPAQTLWCLAWNIISAREIGKNITELTRVSTHVCMHVHTVLGTDN